MFTGIVTDVGDVVSATPRAAGMRFRITTSQVERPIAVGASIACSGPCLTVVEHGAAGDRLFFDVEASGETLARTTLGSWSAGTRINLERALRLGDELGGHIVTGHIDGLAAIVSRRGEADMARFVFEAPANLARYIAEKGSVCLDGTSLTINSVEDSRFEVTVIPHTLAVTTWGERRVGDRVNLEVDLFARYLERLRSAG